MPVNAPVTTHSLCNARVTIMGLGRFGGGLGVAKWAIGRGAHVTVTDLCSEDDLTDSIAELSKLASDETSNGSVRFHLGEHNEDDFVSADLVIANPAVPRPWKNTCLCAARSAGIPITTEIRLVVEQLNRMRTVGVTGSAGKSTTAAMIHHILTELGAASHLGGNIGGSLLNQIESIKPDDVIVLELSSAMLHWLGAGVGFDSTAGWSPHVAVLTNLQPNHIDWHETFEHYAASKQNIFRYQQSGDHQIRGEDFKQRRELPLVIPGKHNQLNGMLALTAALRIASVPPPESAKALSTFPGLPHRLERVAQHGGMQFYNDSKSTLPEATVLAVQSFARPSKLHVIVGGYDKGIDLSPIAQLGPRVARLYGIGATAGSIAETAQPGSVVVCETIDVAVRQASEAMESDHVLLLSPGCASWDQFENFEQRGERFRQLVAQLID